MNENKNKNDNQRYILTRETLGMTILLFCLIMLIMLLTRGVVFSSIGVAVCTFMYGAFGYGCYLVIAALAYLGVWLVWEKSIKVSLKCSLAVTLCVVFCFLLFHAVSARNISTENFGTFVSLCYNNAAQGFSGYTFGGAISAILVYPIAKLTTFIGAYIIFGVLFAGSLYLSVVLVREEVLKAQNRKRTKRVAERKREEPRHETKAQPEPVHVAPQPTVSYADAYGTTENYQIVDNVPRPVYNVPEPQPEPQAEQNNGDKYSRENLGRKILFENGEFAAESYRRNMIFNESSYFNHPVHSDDDYMRSFGISPKSGNKTEEQPTYSESYRESIENGSSATPSSYVYGDKPVEKLDDAPLTEGIYNDESYYVQPEGEQTDSDLNYGNNGESYSEPAPEPENNNMDEPVRGEQLFSGGEQPFARDEQPLNRSEQPFARDEQPFVGNDRAFNRRGEDENVIPDFGGENSRFDREPPIREEHVRDEQNFADEPPARESRGDIFRREEPSRQRSEDVQPSARGEQSNLGEDGGRSSNGLFNLFSNTNPNLDNNPIEPDVSRLDRGRQERSKANLFDDEEEGEDVFGTPLNDRAVELPPEESHEEKAPEVIPERKREILHVTPPTREQVEAVPEAPPKPKHVWKKYVAPPLDLLQNYSESGSTNTAEIEENKQAIVETLANVRIESEIINVIVGSKFTRYDVRIKDSTAIKLALKHKDEIQIALRKDTINAYINFKLAALSIEVPNRESGTVGLKSMLTSGAFLNSKPNSLSFALGKNIEGDCICPDITKMPHLLVAGTTGSGKSICLSSLIVSLLYKYGPNELRFILVDPKQVEFIPYENLPHLMINEIIFDVDKTIKALNWAIKEMERRYQLFKEMTANGMATKDLTEYNAHLPEGEEKLPKIVIILDEFGDLMLQAKKEIETRIVRLVQKARACGIHLILATQRPSVDCITGLIKSNLPTRIGFKVNSFADSSTIFDVGGAEKLLGAGDMYYRRGDRPELQRVQGCFISSSEVQKVTDFVKANNETYFDDTVSEFINTVEAAEDTSSGSSDDGGAGDSDTKIDDTFIKALKYCVTSNQASVSMIQRRFPVGYIKACKIIDWMENMNYITQSEGSKPRKVLLSREEFINTYGDIDD